MSSNMFRDEKMMQKNKSENNMNISYKKNQKVESLFLMVQQLLALEEVKILKIGCLSRKVHLMLLLAGEYEFMLNLKIIPLQLFRWQNDVNFLTAICCKKNKQHVIHITVKKMNQISHF